MMLSKEEALEKAQELSYGWHVGNNEFVPLKDVNKLIREIYSIKPYKFEDLKEDMWVYDSYFQCCCYIVFIVNKNCVRIGYIDGFLYDGPFVENRFFPVQMVNRKDV